jgi:hypothetical protein
MIRSRRASLPARRTMRRRDRRSFHHLGKEDSSHAKGLGYAEVARAVVHKQAFVGKQIKLVEQKAIYPLVGFLAVNGCADDDMVEQRPQAIYPEDFAVPLDDVVGKQVEGVVRGEAAGQGHQNPGSGLR